MNLFAVTGPPQANRPRAHSFCPDLRPLGSFAGPILLSLFLLAGCAATGGPSNLAPNSAAIWALPPTATAQQAAISLDAPLSPDQAVIIALLHRPEAQAIRLEFLAAQSQWRAQIWPNLHISGETLAGTGHQDVLRQTSLGLSLGTIIGWLQAPANMSDAAIIARANAQVEAVTIANQARMAMVDYQAALARMQIAQDRLDGANALLSLFQARFDAGTIPPMPLAEVRAMMLLAQADMVDARAASTNARAAVNAAMGLTGKQADQWFPVGQLADIPAGAVNNGPVGFGPQNQWQLARAEALLRASARQLSPLGLWGGAVDVSGDYVRENDAGQRRNGTAWGISISPFANMAQRQQLAADRARANGLRQRIENEAARLLALKNLYAQSYDALSAPMAAAGPQLVDATSRAVNAMDADFADLAAALNMQSALAERAIGLQRNYWMATYGLELLLAGGMPDNQTLDGNSGARPNLGASNGH